MCNSCSCYERWAVQYTDDYICRNIIIKSELNCTLDHYKATDAEGYDSLGPLIPKAVALRKSTLVAATNSIAFTIATIALVAFMLIASVAFTASISLAGLATLGVLLLGVGAIGAALGAIGSQARFSNTIEILKDANEIDETVEHKEESDNDEEPPNDIHLPYDVHSDDDGSDSG